VARDPQPTSDEIDALVRSIRAARSDAELRALLGPLLRSAREDALTGLLNRGAFEAALASEVERARRYVRSLALCICDLDGFKARNDTRGHAAGDAALARVGAMLRALSRASDVAGRIGGDEFAVVLPEIGATGAAAFAAKLTRALAGDPGDPLALSIGIALFPADARDARALLAIADRRMYQAKARGGGCSAG
jgi:diguanylate cyclase (GGDEF)-like protein